MTTKVKINAFFLFIKVFKHTIPTPYFAESVREVEVESIRLSIHVLFCLFLFCSDSDWMQLYSPQSCKIQTKYIYKTAKKSKNYGKGYCLLGAIAVGIDYWIESIQRATQTRSINYNISYNLFSVLQKHFQLVPYFWKLFEMNACLNFCILCFCYISLCKQNAKKCKQQKFYLWFHCI